MRQSSGNSVIDGISRGIMGAGTAMVERLQAQVKQKDGEIELLQVLILGCYYFHFNSYTLGMRCSSNFGVHG